MTFTTTDEIGFSINFPNNCLKVKALNPLFGVPNLDGAAGVGDRALTGQGPDRKGGERSGRR
jgi:hypothetical protein